MRMTKWRQLIELYIDDERFDLTPYLDKAEAQGWERSPDNAVFYLAEEVVLDRIEPGLDYQIIPCDPRASDA